MIDLDPYELWFVTGSQHLYGPATLDLVEANARRIAAHLDAAGDIPIGVVAKPVMTSAGDLNRLAHEANGDPGCAGLILWMHTFSPARMWISFLDEIHRPLLHLHTQYARDLPWDTIDMDYMNAHQAAHGDREFGYLAARMGARTKIVAGHWERAEVVTQVGTWSRAALAVADSRGANVGRLGDNMREVAVTEGDKVEFQRRFGYAVNGYGVGEIATRIEAATDAEVSATVDAYLADYEVVPELLAGGGRHESLRTAAAIEVAIRGFLADNDLVAFTDTFEDLTGIDQLPGIAAQRIMADGYGFGAEGDWKTACMVRALKVMSFGLPGGTSFMEDYTYHLDPDGALVLGAHMLEVCPTLTARTPRCEIHPLSIGGAADPVRLVFDADPGPAVNASVQDLGDRFRMTACVVDVVEPPQPLPQLPVARSLWRARPDLETAATAWILAGGSHHSCHSTALTIGHLVDYARIVGVELVTIDESTTIRELERELVWNDAAYHLGLR